MSSPEPVNGVIFGNGPSGLKVATKGSELIRSSTAANDWFKPLNKLELLWLTCLIREVAVVRESLHTSEIARTVASLDSLASWPRTTSSSLTWTRDWAMRWVTVGASLSIEIGAAALESDECVRERVIGGPIET